MKSEKHLYLRTGGDCAAKKHPWHTCSILSSGASIYKNLNCYTRSFREICILWWLIGIYLSRESWTVQCLLHTVGSCLKSFRLPCPFPHNCFSISFLIPVRNP